MAKKKYRMRTVPEVQEPIIDYVDPRTKSLQALDIEPNDKIIHSLVTNDLEKAKSRIKRKARKNRLEEKHNIYFSSGKEGLGRLLISMCQIVMLSSFFSFVASLSFLVPDVKDLFLEWLPIKDERFLVLFVPVAIVVGIVIFALVAIILVIILLPILASHKVETIIKWSRVSWILSIIFGISLLVTVVVFEDKLMSKTWNYDQWEIVHSLSEVSFLTPKIIIGVALGVSTILGYPMVISSAKKQRKENVEIENHNLKKYQQ